MRMMCCGLTIPCCRRAPQIANDMKPRDDLLAVLVGDASAFVDERVFVRVATQTAKIVIPRDDLLAELVGDVSIFGDERVFGRVAQIVIPCDDLLAVLVGDVSIFGDERVSGGVAIAHAARPPVSSLKLIIPLQLVLLVEPRANVAHFAELLERCVFDEQAGGVVPQ